MLRRGKRLVGAVVATSGPYGTGTVCVPRFRAATAVLREAVMSMLAAEGTVGLGSRRAGLHGWDPEGYSSDRHDCTRAASRV